MGRSIKKGPFVDDKLAKKKWRLMQKGPESVNQSKLWSRRSTVTPEFVGLTDDDSQRKRYSRRYLLRKIW